MADGQPQGRPELVKQDLGAIRSLGITKNGTFFFGNYAQMTREVCLANLDPTTQKVVGAATPLIQPFSVDSSSPDWSSDGKFLAFRTTRISGLATKPSVFISIRSLETGEARKLSPSMKSFYLVKWSPDGRSLLLVGTNDKSQFGLHIVDAQTGNLTAMVLDGYWGSWSPDGGRLMFVRRNFKKDKYEVWQIPVKGGEPQAVGLSTTAISPISMHPDGKRIAFGAGQHKAEMWVMENFLPKETKENPDEK